MGSLTWAGRGTTRPPACRQLNYTRPLATGLAILAWIRQAHGDAAGALEAMAEAERPGRALL